MDIRQTKPAYALKMSHIRVIRENLKDYMMKRFAWNGQFGKRSNKILISQAYTLAAKPFTNKIKALRKGKTRLDRRQEKVKAVGKAVEEYLNTNIRYTARNNSTQEARHIGRCIFCKYVFENVTCSNGLTITGRHIRNYLSPNVDKMRSSNPSEWRRRFTQSFVNYPERKTLYMDFVQYMRTKHE